MFSKTKIFLAIILLILIFPMVAGAAGLVPCGGDGESPCTLCHFIIGFKGLIDYGFKVIIVLAIVAIFAAGTMYIISTGDEGMMTKAKGFLKATLYGFAFVFLGWLIVDVTMIALSKKSDLGIGVADWNTFTCDTTSTEGQGGTLPTENSDGKWKCSYGACSQIVGGTYNSREECEKSPTCKTTCADYHLACKSEMPCCDTTQQCAQNPSLPEGKKWCIKPGEESKDLNCGNKGLGTCMQGTFSCPDGYSHLWGGNDCPGINQRCCVANSKEGGICSSEGTCKTESVNCTQVSTSTSYPECASGLKCCKGDTQEPPDSPPGVPPGGEEPPPAEGNSDLIITSMGFSNCCDNNKTFTASIAIKNQGTGAAGAFAVKGYMSFNENIDFPLGVPMGKDGDSLMCTWLVSSLAAGAVEDNAMSCKFGAYPIHQSYNLIFKIDADDKISETNEANNIRLLSFFLSR